MSTIDQIIAEFHAAGAERLLMASGKEPVLTTDEGSRGIRDGEPLDRDQLEGMVLAMDNEISDGQNAFDYEAPTGQVHVTVRVTPNLMQIIIVPAHAAGVAGAPSEDAFEMGSAEAPEMPSHDAVETPSTEADGLEAIAQELAEAQHGQAQDAEFQFAADTVEEEHAVEGLSHFSMDEGAEDTAWLDEGGVLDPWEGSDEAGAVDEGSDEGSEDLPFLMPIEQPQASMADGEGAADEPPMVAAASTDPLEQVDDAAPPALEVRSDAPAIDRLFVKMVGKGCSDLHISAGSVPLFRKDGRIVDLGGEPELTAGQVEALLMGITPDRYRKLFEEKNDVDFAYEIPGVARFRCNLFRDRKGAGGVFRQIPADIMTAEQLGLHPQLLEMCQLKKGLVLVTGPTGSGKSTTLAALIDYINQTREDHIITIEDPIEFVHPNKKCLINQREIGEHTESFKVALRAALREDPDIVLVGELRDLETVEIALETAETGHLVFGTLHTNTAAGTVSRLIDQFPSGQQAQIRTMLAETLQGVIAQTLCRRVGGGRVAALEILVVTNAVANLIREDKTHQIISAMQTGGAQGMKTLNDALFELIQRRTVEPREAYWNAVDKPEFQSLLSRNGIELEGAPALQAS